SYGNEVVFTTLSYWTCGAAITISHVAGPVVPVSKTVSYGTATNIPGETTKCWTTRNLGATRQAVALDDATELSSGWFWQFNRKQGYKQDGTTLTPSWTITSITENINWQPANDPCALQLGSGWRIPTSSEWFNVDETGNWNNQWGPWNSGLKLHFAGGLNPSNGSPFGPGGLGLYWSSTQSTGVSSTFLYFDGGNGCYPSIYSKSYGMPLRCVNDYNSAATVPTVTTSPASAITQNTAISGGNITSDGGAGVTDRGICWNTSPNPTISNSHTTEGSGTGAFVSNITEIPPDAPCYVRAYATNNVGTSYGNEVVFTTLSYWTCGAAITVSHVAGTVAPVSKTVSYGTATNIPGETTKCWTTRNLGATRQAVALDDATEPSSGWFWQFNRKQGYKQDGTTLTPAWTITTIDENLDWEAGNDPCSLVFGSRWRIPTVSEWLNVDEGGNWNNCWGAWNSGLKLHFAGGLNPGNGSPFGPGGLGLYWSSTQSSAVNGWFLYFDGGNGCFSSSYLKTYGMPLRCLKNIGVSVIPTVTTSPVSGISLTSAIAGGQITSDGGEDITVSGVCWSTAQNPTISGNHSSEVNGTTIFTSNITGLIPNTVYFVRAYATNSIGTAYGNEVSFITLSSCGSVTAIHLAGNVAPVDKTVTYGTVTNIPGEPSKCWITNNLGADRQATALEDATEASSGWFWQFNRKQGYKHDGSTRTPGSTWITSIIENLDWQSTNDPCALELGGGWRLPTYFEYFNVDASENWTNWNGPWNSGLKLHAAGALNASDGSKYGGGYYGYYWSSRQNENSVNEGTFMAFQSDASHMYSWYSKAYAFPLRCLKALSTTDQIQVISPNGGETFFSGSVHTVAWSSPAIPNVKIEYSTNNGSSWNTIIASVPGTPGSYSWTVPNTPSSNCWIKISDAADLTKFDMSNSSFTVLNPFTCAPVTYSDSIGVNYNTPVSIPVMVDNFRNITAVSLILDYDPAVLTYTGTANINPLLDGSIINNANLSANLSRVLISWSDANPATLSDGSKIMDIMFTYISGSTGLLWNNISNDGQDCEYADSMGNALTDTPTAVFYQNGAVYYRPGWQLSGSFVYNNSANTPLDNVKVVLLENSIKVDSAMTNGTGHFQFESIVNGSYLLKAYTNKPFGGLNATDAVKIQRHFTLLEPLTEPVRLLAGDVNNSNFINATDAVKVKRRFTLIDTTFLRGNWTFAKQTLSGDTLSVNGANITQNYFGLCVGDVNGSYVPAPGDGMLTMVEMATFGTIEVSPGQIFDLPVKVSTGMDIGAVSLVIPYPAGLLEAIDISMTQGSPLFNVTKGEIRIAWSEIEPLNLNAGETLLILRLRAKESFTGDQTIELRPTNESEIADDIGKPMQLSELSTFIIKPLKPNGTGEQTGAVRSFRVYPNPATNLVYLEFELINQSGLIVEWYNGLGERLKMFHFDDLSMGRHKKELDVSGFANGVYTLKTTVKGRNTATMYHKLIISK
ncbi:MAG: T9SS type A sorting domain-containing protein, partial [Bacteroidota bacterium]